MRRLDVLAATLLGVAAGSDPASPGRTPPPTTYTLNTSRQWSGGQVMLRSSLSNAGHPNILVVAGEDTVVGVAVDDTTYAFGLPLGPSGPLQISVTIADGGPDSIGVVDRAGYLSSRGLDSVYWSLTSWRPGGALAVLGFTLSGVPASADLLTGAATLYPALFAPEDGFVYGASVSATSTAGEYVLRDSSRHIGVWQLGSTATKVGDGPEVTAFDRQLFQVSANIWVGTYHHSYTVTHASDSAVRSGDLEGARNVVVSPDGHYTTFAGYSYLIGGRGIPLLDSRTGDGLNVLPIEDVFAATFSADSRLLFSVGASGGLGGRDTLVAIDPADLTIQRRVALPDSGTPFAIRHDQASNRIFIGVQKGSNFEVLIYDATSFEMLGRLPGTAACTVNCGGGDLTLDPEHGHLLVAVSGSPVTVHTFDLLP